MNGFVRAETSADLAAVQQVHERAFNRPDEARLVNGLRTAAKPHVSLVFELDGRVVGHVFFSEVTLHPEQGELKGMGLAPLAVLPEFQRQGAGAALVRAGLESCRHLGYHFAVVLGHADYYPRFGFGTASKQGLRSEYPVPDDVFMVALLEPGTQFESAALIKYHPEFAKL